MNKPLLVMLPGMLCDERLFHPQIEAFQSSHKVIVGELTAAGSIAELAENLFAQLPDVPFDLLGLSMGGIVAMEMAGQASERVQRMALLDTNHLSEIESRKKNRDRQIEDVRSGKLEQVIIDEMKPNYLAAAHRDNQPLLDLLITMALDLGPETFISQSLALRERRDQTENLRQFQGPLLALCGEEDGLCPPERSLQISDLAPKGELVIVPNAGHISTLENPRYVNQAIRTWLDKPL